MLLNLPQSLWHQLTGRKKTQAQLGLWESYQLTLHSELSQLCFGPTEGHTKGIWGRVIKFFLPLFY